MRQVVFALLKKINYAYDHSGERTLKMTGDAYDVDQNAREQYLFASLNNITIYPSPYTVVSNQGYTKHYYAGAERVAARLGGGGLGYDTACISQNPEVSRCADILFQHVLKSVNSYEYQKQDSLDVVRIDGSVLGEASEFNGDNFPIRLNADVRAEPWRLNRIIEGLSDSVNPIVIDSSYEPDVYFYHSDHLGSASWITDAEGIPVQHLQYLPFGEPFVNQRISGYQERFTFTGKERDAETGFSYFGARYYDSDLSGLFLSVDPMADKYPGLSPYAYCAWNPVKLVDPDGRKIRGVKYNKKTGEIKYRRYAIRNGTKRYIDARLTTVNGRAGIQSMIESKRRFDIRVTDLPLFIETDNNQYGQLHGKTIVDDYGLKTIIIVSTAEKNTGNCIGLVVSDKRVKGEQYISENDVSTRANPIQYKLMEDMGMFEFEKEHPYHSDIQKIHGIGAHEEEHALREIINKKQEEINALNTEKKERLQFIDEYGID